MPTFWIIFRFFSIWIFLTLNLNMIWEKKKIKETHKFSCYKLTLEEELWQGFGYAHLYKSANLLSVFPIFEAHGWKVT